MGTEHIVIAWMKDCNRLSAASHFSNECPSRTIFSIILFGTGRVKWLPSPCPPFLRVTAGRHHPPTRRSSQGRALFFGGPEATHISSPARCRLRRSPPCTRRPTL